MKKVLITLIAAGLLLIMFILAGCVNESLPLPLHQELDNVTGIELLDTRGNEAKILYTFDQEEIPLFWEQLTSLKAGRYFNDPATEYGPCAIKIDYSDGSIDIIGIQTNRYIAQDGKREKYDGWYYIADEEALAEILSQYISIEQLFES